MTRLFAVKASPIMLAGACSKIIITKGDPDGEPKSMHSADARAKLNIISKSATPVRTDGILTSGVSIFKSQMFNKRIISFFTSEKPFCCLN